jgi:hypothetical protein
MERSKERFNVLKNFALCVLLSIAACTACFIIPSSAALVQITNVNILPSIDENTGLNVSFEAETTLNESINYSIYMNGIVVSSSNSYATYFDYSAAGTYDFVFVASDSQSNTTENHSLVVIDKPLRISVLNPSNATYGSRNIVLNLTTTNDVLTCSYSLNHAAYQIMDGSGNNFFKSITVSADGLYILDFNCSNNFDNAAASSSFTVDTSTPTITARSYAIDNDYDVEMRLSTNTPASCKYDVSDKGYDAMAHVFDQTGSTQHSTTITGLADGNYVYYVKCKGVNPIQTPEQFSFSIARKPTAAITLSGSPPLKAGTYSVTVKTSKPVQNTPTLYYTFNNENTQKTVSLTGSGSEWNGYLIIDDNTPNKVGTFHFSAADFMGVTGTIITNGELFLIDTTKPIAVSSVGAYAETNRINLKWYYDGEPAKKFNIYRSNSSTVSYVDYYDVMQSSNGPNYEFDDTDVDASQIYFYRVAAVDEAGNEGELSDTISAQPGQSSSAQESVVLPKSLDAALVPKVDEIISAVETMILDVQSRKSEMQSITDSNTLKVIALMKLNAQIDTALSSLDSISKQLSDLKNTDLLSSELNIRLNKLRMDAIKAQANVVEDIKVDEVVTNEQLTSEADVDAAISFATKNMNLSRNALQEYRTDNKRIQDTITVRAEAILFRIKYFTKDEYERYTIVKKSVSSSGNIDNAIVMEIIPKELEKSTDDIDFSNFDQPVASIIEKDPVVQWSVQSLSSSDFYYKLNTLADDSAIKNSRTVVLKKPQFTFSDTQSSDSAAGATGLTGMSVFDKLPFSGLTLVQWAIIVGVISVLLLFGYYRSLTSPKREKSSAALPAKSSIKLPAKSSTIQKHVLTLKPVHSHIQQRQQNAQLSPKRIPVQPIRQQSSRQSQIQQHQPLQKLSVQQMKERELFTRLDYCNSIANNLKYEDALHLYTACLKNFNTVVFTSGHTKIEAGEMLEHIYLKLISYKSVLDAWNHAYHKDAHQLQLALKNATIAYGKIRSNLPNIIDAKKHEEKTFADYIHTSLEKIRKLY